MTPEELRSRIARSGFSGKQLAAALGIAQPQVVKWCGGVRPIPEHHVPAIIRLTDNPPQRTVLARRSDMQPSQSKGHRGKATKQLHAAAVLPAAPPPKQESPEPIGAAGWAGVIDTLNGLLGSFAGSNSVAPVPTKPSPGPAPPASAKPAPAPASAVTAAMGPLHTDFVNQHNAEQQRGANSLSDGIDYSRLR